MKLRLDVLPPPQLVLWPQLHYVPQEFVLYGGTAIALQLGHRESVDFDFFSALPLNKDKLVKNIPFLAHSKFVHPEINTLNCSILVNHDYVKLQFLAGIAERQGRVEKPLISKDNGIKIASLRDLLATKLNTIQARAEIKDYIDIDAIINHGISLATGLGCAQAIFGENFDFGTSLRALCSYRDGDLHQLPKEIKNRLMKAAVSIEEIPIIKPISRTI